MATLDGQAATGHRRTVEGDEIPPVDRGDRRRLAKFREPRIGGKRRHVLIVLGLRGIEVRDVRAGERDDHARDDHKGENGGEKGDGEHSRWLPFEPGFVPGDLYMGDRSAGVKGENAFFHFRSFCRENGQIPSASRAIASIASASACASGVPAIAASVRKTAIGVAVRS